MHRFALLMIVAILAVGELLASASLADDGREAPSSEKQEAARFVGSQSCASCHVKEHTEWRGSHHHAAMQEAKDDTVLGDFNGAIFAKGGVETSFFKRDNKFWVRTDGPDGKVADFEVRYTFGFSPLQQYLIAMPRGAIRLSASPGIPGQRRSADSGGITSIPTSLSRRAVRCIGPALTRTGTTSVHGAIRPICKRTMMSKAGPSKPPGPRSTLVARRAMGLRLTMWRGQTRPTVVNNTKVAGKALR